MPTNHTSGAFYLWIDSSGSGLPGSEFARRLALEREVAVVPGTAFGPSSSGRVRVSLATAPELLEEGVTRLAAAINDWGG